MALDLLQCHFANTFVPIVFDLAWHTRSAIQLTRGMYDFRDFSAMPILADALQDAGCDSAATLDYCRRPGPHVRGCRVVDLAIGRQ